MVRTHVRTRGRAGLFCCRLLAAGLVVSATAASGGDVSEGILAADAHARVRDRADVPARDRGVLSGVSVRAGAVVEAGQLLGRVDDTEARLTRRAAELDLAVARSERDGFMDAQIAEAAIREAQLAQAKAEAELAVAREKAGSDVDLRLARTRRAVAQEELDRSQAARQRFSSSVSQLELSRLQAERDARKLEGETATHRIRVDRLTIPQHEASVAAADAAVARLRLQRQDADARRAVLDARVSRLEVDVEIAEAALRRKEILAPLSGLVVERLRRDGEWVEPGEPVLRVVGLETLWVEGYVDAGEVDAEAIGRDATVRVEGADSTLPASVVFVDPEVDSVNGQVLVRVDVANAGGRLRPGQRVELRIGRE